MKGNMVKHNLPSNSEAKILQEISAVVSLRFATVRKLYAGTGSLFVIVDLL